MAKGRYDNKGPISAFAEAAKRSFNPEGSGYDYESAKAAGLGPDETGHWPSRNPRTGQILKGKAHATFHKTEASEKKAGFTIKKGENGRYYSFKDDGTDGVDDPAGVPNVLEQNRGKNFVDRMFDPTPPVINNPDGSISTHIMTDAEVDSGDGTGRGKFIVYPTVIQKEEGAELIEVSAQEAQQYALETGEFIEFDTQEEATAFSTNGYKQLAPEGAFTGVEAHRWVGDLKYGLDNLPTNEHSGYKKDRKRRMKAKADASKRAKRLQPLMDKGGY